MQTLTQLTEVNHMIRMNPDICSVEGESDLTNQRCNGLDTHESRNARSHIPRSPAKAKLHRGTPSPHRETKIELRSNSRSQSTRSRNRPKSERARASAWRSPDRGTAKSNGISHLSNTRHESRAEGAGRLGRYLLPPGGADLFVHCGPALQPEATRRVASA